MASSTSFRPIVLCGPSGCGKSTLIKRMMEDPLYKGRLGFSVSHTSRGPRPGEGDGESYHFSNMKSMQAMVENDEFLEHATFAGNMYGTSKSAVLAVQEKGLCCILDIDTQGVRQMRALDEKNKGINAAYVFIDVPDLNVLEKRLRGRGTETEEKILKRLSKAEEERKLGSSSMFDVRIVNDILNEAYNELSSVMQKFNPGLASH